MRIRTSLIQQTTTGVGGSLTLGNSLMDTTPTYKPTAKRVLILFMVFLPHLLYAKASQQADLETYHNKVKPLLQKYCFQCHGEKKSKGDIRFDTMDPDILTGQDGGKWEDALQQFNIGDMPPDDEDQPTDEERDIIGTWLDKEFKKASLVGRANKNGDIRRLTRYELKYTLEDLFKISSKEAVSNLPEETQSHETGLKNNTSLLMMSSPYLESYLETIFHTIEKIKKTVNYIPYSTSLDIAKVEFKPAKALFRADNETNKPKPKEQKAKKPKRRPMEKTPFHHAELKDGTLIINRNGYMTLKIPKLPKGLFKSPIQFKAPKATGELELIFGFKYSKTDRREILESFGYEKFTASAELQTLQFEGYIDHLSETMKRSMDKEYFIRVQNKSNDAIHIHSFDFFGNDSHALKTSLIGSTNPNEKINDLKSKLNQFITKAYRRKATKEELHKYQDIYHNYNKSESNLNALLSTYEEILCSPKFLYLGAFDKSKTSKENFYLAEKLSYFLWSSIPDKALMHDAIQGRLSDDKVLKSHVQRMLKDDRAKRLVENFTDQCLDTRKLFNVAVSDDYYKGFKNSLKPHMRQETIESINDVFRNGATALNLIKADHVFVNEELAKFYKIKGVSGSEFRKVNITENDNRGGLLTQGTFLIGNSDGSNSHAILRGVWLTSIILNSPPPEPPKNVPPLDDTIPGFDKMTLNQKMMYHRNHDACRSCHNKIDPWGMPFENYDASGSWRSRVLVISEKKGENVKKNDRFEKSYLPIERESTLASKEKIDGMLELKNHIVEHRKDDFAKGLTKKILSYALSRDVDFYDSEIVNKLQTDFKKENYSVSTLIENIVFSKDFKEGNI